MYYFYINRVHPPGSSFYVPWNHFMEYIMLFFRSKKIQITPISNVKSFKKDDVIIFFAFDRTSNLKGRNGKYIAINTEGFFSEIKGDPHYVKLKRNLEGINIIQIWDYTFKNINCGKFKNHIYVPPGYSRFIEKNISMKKDLDIVFYGGISSRRKKILDGLKQRLGDEKVSIVKTNESNHIKTVKRAKIVIDIHYYEHDKPIDYYRISPLLSNRVFVIHEDVQKEDKNTDAYKHLSKSLIFSEYDNFIDVCEKWLNKSHEERDDICEKSYKIFKKEFSLDNFVKI